MKRQESEIRGMQSAPRSERSNMSGRSGGSIRDDALSVRSGRSSARSNMSGSSWGGATFMSAARPNRPVPERVARLGALWEDE